MFTLHERLAADTEEVARLELCLALLMNDSTYPWLILVPEFEGLRDFHDVPADAHDRLMRDITRASTLLQRLHDPVKINVAALGNSVPQLHIHVIARHTADPAWPGPVWGAAPVVPYGAAELEDAVTRLREALAR